MYEFLEYRVEDVMSEPLAVEPTTSLAEVQALLEEHGYNALPVVDASGGVVGLATSLDVLRAFSFSEDTILPPYDEVMKAPVSQVMSLDVATVRPRTPLTRVITKIVDTRNKSFPVVDGGRLVGMVAREDVMGALRRSGAGRGPGQGEP